MFMRNHTGVNLYHKAFVGLVEFVREVRWNYRWTDKYGCCYLFLSMI